MVLTRGALPLVGISRKVVSSFAGRWVLPLSVTASYGVVSTLGWVITIPHPDTTVAVSLLDGFLGGGFDPAFSLSTMVMVPAGVGLALTWLTVSTRKTATASVEAELRALKLSRYFSPNVAAGIGEGDDSLFRSGGNEQDVCVLFCDIRGFTTLSERL